MDYDTLRSIQLLALQATEKPTYNDFYRKVCRWYSSKFSTPLRDVEGMEEEYILKHYFEDSYISLYESDESENKQSYERIRDSIVTDVYEQEAAAKEDDEWVAQMQQEVAASNTPIGSAPETLENPNLIKEGSVPGETEIPVFDDDQE